jgi:hypothetical protein
MDDYDGRLLFKNGVEYQGAIENGNINGKGKMTFTNWAVYAGAFINNKIEGQGRLDYSPSEHYVGQFVNFQKSGHGVYVNTQTGINYQGEWIADCFHGRGTLVKERCWRYEGGFSCNLKDGYGEMQYLGTGSYFKGQFREGVKNGQGEMFWASQNHHFVGQWQDDAICGFGVYTYLDALDFNRYVNNIYVGPMVGAQKEGIGFHIFSDGSVLSGRWVDGIKEGDFVYRDSFGHFCLKKFAGNHLKGNAQLQVDPGAAHIEDQSLPKIQLLDPSQRPELFANFLKTYYSFLKEVYRDTLMEVTRGREKARQIFCLNLAEIVGLFKTLRLFDARLSPFLFDRLIQSNDNNALVLDFKANAFEEFTAAHQNFMEGKLHRFSLPYTIRGSKQEEVYFSSSQFVNAVFLALQLRFTQSSNIESRFRRYFEEVLIPVAQKKLKLVSFIQDQKSILALYSAFAKANAGRLGTLFDSLKCPVNGFVPNRRLLGLLVDRGLIALDNISHVAVFLRVVELYSDPFTSVYAVLKERKSLTVVQKSLAFRDLLSNGLSLEEFTNSVFLCIHKIFVKRDNSFPKNDVLALVSELLDSSRPALKRPVLLWNWHSVSLNRQSSQARTISAIRSGVLSQQTEPDSESEVRERNRQAEEQRAMAAEDQNALTLDFSQSRAFWNAAGSSEFKDSVPEFAMLPKRSL